MSEPKLTVGRVQTWRPIPRWLAPNDPYLADAINERMAELFPPAPPQPEAAKPEPEPDTTCPICKKHLLDCRHSVTEITVAANARIRELERERDELEDEWHVRWGAAEREARAAGAAAMREAIAKRLEERGDRHTFSSPFAARIARETEVPT